MRRLVPLAAMALLVAMIVTAHFVRVRLDLDPSPAAVQEWVAGFGAKGAAVFLALVVFRQFLALPAMLLLLAGGICFGTVLGGTLGAAGIVLSGMMKFQLARLIGRDVLRRRGGQRLERWQARAARVGPAVVALGTAHPLGPLSPLHWAAGLSPLSFGSFVTALVIGAPVRAFAYSFFGQSLLDADSASFRLAIGLLIAGAAVPLLVPRFRARLKTLLTE